MINNEVDFTGSVALGNRGNGIAINGTGNLIGTEGSGAYEANERNIVSGNGKDGIFVVAAKNKIAGNYIGVDVTGSFALSNHGNGINIRAAGNLVGTNGDGNADDDERNVISGNNGSGILLDDHSIYN